MTNEQMLEVCRLVFPVDDAALYGLPKLHDGTWTVGFKREREEMALQAEFEDREIHNDAERYAAIRALENRVRGVLLLSM